MTWSKVGDELHSHPKAVEADLEAMGLWVLALSHCGAYLTDGHVKRSAALRIAGDPARLDRLAGDLVRVGLWEPHPSGDGWQIHDYLEFNPSREEVLAARQTLSEKRAEAGRRGAEKRWQRDSKPMANPRLPDGNAMATDGPVPSRSRPDPGPAPPPPVPDRDPSLRSGGAPAALPGLEVKEPNEGKRAKAKGSRIAADWKPPEELVQWAAELGVDAIAVAPSFVDHFRAKAGENALKLDWDAAFRNWVREEIRRGTAPALQRRLSAAPPEPAPFTPQEVVRRLAREAIEAQQKSITPLTIGGPQPTATGRPVPEDEP